MMSETVRVATFVTLTSVVAVSAVLGTACASIGLTLALQATLTFVLSVIATLGEVGIAVVAAIASGFTVSLTVIVAASTAAISVPPTRIEARLLISAIIATASIVTSAIALITMTSLRLDIELGVAVVTSAAVAVAFASVWAVGVMSLVERETHQVGLKMTSLLQAVRHNKYHVLSILVRVPFGSHQGEPDTALLYAVKAGFVECVRVLISAGACPNTQDAYSCTPLISASQHGSVEMMTMLIEAGAIVNFRNANKETALHHAAKSGHDQSAKMLLDHGADPGVQDALWRTPLMLAIRHAKKPAGMIQMLLEAGCPVNAPGCEHRTALHYAALRGIHVDVLLAAGADCGVRDAEGNTPLHLAALEGNLENVHAMLSVDADANAANYIRRSPLHLGALSGSVPCIEDLIVHGADPLSADNGGQLPINHAVLGKAEEAVFYFLRRNLFTRALEPGMRPPRGNKSAIPLANPLQLALEKGYFHLARPLLLGGCDRTPIYERHILMDRAVLDDDYQAMPFVLLKSYVQEPWALTDLCRCTIRRRLRHPLTDAPRLPIPKQIQEFLLLMDLDDPVTPDSLGM